MGPVSDDDLHRLLISGTITSSSLVWKTGMAGWQPAAEVEGLAPMLASLPPELPPELPPDQETPERTETFSWDRAEQLLPGMTAELNAFLESHFTRAREEAITVLHDLKEKVLHNYRRTSPLAQIQLAYDGLLEYAQNKLREQMLAA
jgi:GYF domain 2